jgi:hypothetical protein
VSDDAIVAGVFEDVRAGEEVLARLISEGAPEGAVSLIRPGDDATQRIADAGISPGKAALYEDALRRGYALLIARVPPQSEAELTRMLARSGARALERSVVPASDVRFEPFREAVLELPEFTEEIIAVKRPWVVEEVVVTKVVRERTEVVHETLRRRDVTVEDLPK